MEGGARALTRMMPSTLMANLMGFTVTGELFDVRVSVVCPVCNARRFFSRPGSPLSMLLSLWKSLETLEAGGTSITYQLELKPHTPQSDNAFRVWPDSRNTESTALRTFGKSTEGESTIP